MSLTSTHAMRSRPLEVLRSLCGFLGIAFHPDIFPLASVTVFKGTGAGIITDEMRAFVRARMERIYAELRRDWPELAAELLEPGESPAWTVCSASAHTDGGEQPGQDLVGVEILDGKIPRRP